MRNRRVMIGVFLVAAVTACIPRPGTLEQALAPGAQWTVSLTPTATSNLHGTVSFVRTDPPNVTRAIFSLTGGTPNAILPWHVHYGVCGDDHLIAGKASSYPLLVLSSTGALTAAADIPVELADRTNYVIHIHASAVDMQKVIACGPLVPLQAIASGR